MIEVTAIDKSLYPKQSTEWSAWFDVFAATDCFIQPWWVALIPLWIKLKMDKWECCFVMSRSSMPIKKWCLVPNWVWLIDSDYRWELHLEVYNFSKEVAQFAYWEKCWQLVFINYKQDIALMPTENYDNWEELHKSERWTWWFWSTWN